MYVYTYTYICSPKQLYFYGIMACECLFNNWYRLSHLYNYG